MKRALLLAVLVAGCGDAPPPAPMVVSTKSPAAPAEMRVKLTLDDAAQVVHRTMDGRELATDADLAAAIHDAHAAWTAKGKPDAPITIDAAPTVAWTEVQKVVNAAKREGLTKIEFAMGAPPAKPLPPATQENAMTTPTDFYSIKTSALDGSDGNLAQYRGKVALVVNVASECGFTPQYAGLETLAKDYAGKGLVVLGFPSNEFGGQEPGSADEIRSFCTKNFGVTFPLFAKVETKKGAGQSPVYAALSAATGKEPNWNFCKYLVGKDGKVLKFWASKTTPESAELRGAIDAALK